MKGLEISRAFWEEHGKPMMEERFPELLDLTAVGLVGPGSECFGYDDEISRDHDFEHGFCIYLPDEERVSRRKEFLLGRAYESLPKEFMGLRRSLFNPAGVNRRGVFRTEDIYRQLTGFSGPPGDWRAYLSVPDCAMAEVTNGEVFFDGLGEFSAIREAWRNPPEDVQRKKLCGYLIRMSQTGEYNHPRCLERGDEASAFLTAAEFVKAAAAAFGWVYNRPSPYYKWCLRFVQDLPKGEMYAGYLKNALCPDGSTCIAEARILLTAVLQEQGLVPEGTEDLQKAAFIINDGIRDGVLRSLSPLAAVRLE